MVSSVEVPTVYAHTFVLIFFWGGGGVLEGEVSAQWAWSVICSLQLRRHQQDTVVRVSCSVQAPALLLHGFPQLTHSIPLWLSCSVVPLTWGSVSYTYKSGCNFLSNVTGKPADRCTLLFYLHDPCKTAPVAKMFTLNSSLATCVFLILLRL